ncbi:DNA alkylation repair protein [Caloranaerobacter azorensis]|uniref:DNA alkylation repair protein n=1 Tax=Caloranaerobacter azorensis TaxID=116090 RepID=UPI000ABF39BF|nr:DNA alkylation repair protein [Caloranaerobacter azorensis]
MYKEIISLFYENRNDSEAEKMAAYMKNKFPFLGIKKPQRAALQEQFIKQSKKKKEVDWDLIFKLWDLPEREFQYLAVDMLVALRNKLSKKEIVQIEKLITEKSWWDTVDLLASKLIGYILQKYPEGKKEIILRWSKSDNIWLSRTAILFQLRYKDKTDLELLSQVIFDNINSDEFFINKAIGWALREYSKTDKCWVKNFISQNKLSPLSVKEGSKYL